MSTNLYYCSNCSKKTTSIEGLIKRSGGGCSSCGKSNYKCPNCGMPMRIRRISTQQGPDPKTQNNTQTTTFRQEQVVRAQESFTGSRERQIRINRSK